MDAKSQALLFLNSLSEEDRLEVIAASQRQTSQTASSCNSIFDQLPDAIKEYLKEHQKEAIEFLYKRIIEPPNGFYNKDGGKGAIIAHNMGLGKTTTTVAFLYGILNEPAIRKQNFKILIVSPVNVIEHWMAEFRKDIWGGFFDNEACFCQLESVTSSDPGDPHDMRRIQLTDWYKGVRNKSVLILGYEIYDIMLAEDKNDKTLELLKVYLQNPGPDIIIYDEGHRLKNNKTLSYITKMEVKTNRRIILSGTPLENDTMELYHIVEMAVPGFLDKENLFYRNYAQKIDCGKVTNASEAQGKVARETEGKLYEKLQEVMNRKDAEYLHKLINVSKKEITITFCETEEQKTLIDEVEDEYKNAKPGDKVFLTYYNRLLYLTSHPVIVEVKQHKRKCDQKLANCSIDSKDPKRSNKMKALFDLIEACDEKEQKLVIYTQSLATLDYIQHQLSAKQWQKGVDFFRVDGEIKPKQRALDFNEFNNKNNKRARLFLLTIKAGMLLYFFIFRNNSEILGSVGINLIGANRMVLFDHCFNPVHNTQATYRIYRIGQESGVFIYRFITQNSSDDCVLRRQIAKEACSKRLIDGRKVAPRFSEDDIKIRRGHGDYELITDERIEELESEYDEIFINVIKKNMDGIIDVSDHDENFQETVNLELEDEKSII